MKTTMRIIDSGMFSLEYEWMIGDGEAECEFGDKIGPGAYRLILIGFPRGSKCFCYPHGLKLVSLRHRVPKEENQVSVKT